MALRVYGYAKCDTCRKALRFLGDRSLAFESIPIRERPPTVEELRAMLGYLGGDLRRLFNTSGQDYKALKMKERLPGMPPEEALRMLSENGNLVKRPFALSHNSGRTGFKPDEWEQWLGCED